MTSPITDVVTPPTREIGYTSAVAGGGVPGWGSFAGSIMDPYEDVPQLAWPNSVITFHRMRTDAQIDALTKAVTLPLRRLNWKIKPNGARDEVVNDISQQLCLPIQGDNDEFIITGRQRFDHDEHLRMALLAPLVYGHMPFEQVGEVDADDLRWKLTKLAPRMPQTIQWFQVNTNGDLEQIWQYGTAANAQYMDINTGGQRGKNRIVGASGRGIPIPRTQLAFYGWEVEGGNYAGRSMMRPLYKYYLLKDRMLRVDAIKNERFGAGIPTGTAPPGGDPADYSKMAQAVRASENGGVGLPNGASIGIEGIRGTLPDTLASIRMYDEQMARSFLAMMMQLGQTQSGSRALGDTFMDFFEDSLWGFVKWYSVTTTQDVIWDIVDWNWGEDEQAPMLTAEEDPEEPLSAQDLANLVRAGALLVDAELENWIRQRFWMPEYTGGAPLPTKPGDISQESTPPGNTADPATASGTRQRIRITDKRSSARVAAGGTPSKGTPKDKRLKENKTAKVSTDRQTVKAHGDHDQKSHGNRAEKSTVPARVPGSVLSKQRTTALPDGGNVTITVEAAGHKHVIASSQTLNDDRMGHREPNAVEAAAQTDFAKIQQTWQDLTDKLVQAWGDIRSQQISDLVDQVKAAVKAGDTATLGALEPPVAGGDVLAAHMTEMADQAIAEALAEAERQGVTLPAVNVADLSDTITGRADAVSNIVARDLTSSASKNALIRYAVGVDPEEVGAGVETALGNLTDSYLADMLGGAMTGAQNDGRMAVMEQDSGATIYASELMDENTCDACSAIDETQYDTMADAISDYPSGGFVDCQGGMRCRGTLVAVYGEGQD